MARSKILLTLLLMALCLSPPGVSSQATFTGGGLVKVVPNDPTTGTVLNGLAKVTPTGAMRSTTADTAIPLWIVVGGAGTSSSVPAALAVSGDVDCLMDATASNVRGQFVVQSPTQNNQCHAQVTEPSNGMVIGTMAQDNITAGQKASVSPGLIAYKPGSGAGTGSVTSVALSMPPEFSVSGSPITASGTFTVTEATQTANQVYASATSGGAAAPNFRGLVTADLAGTSAMTTCAGDLAGTAPNCTVAQASGAFALPGDVTPTTLSGDVGDYAGCTTGTAVCRINGGGADRLITGLAGGADGRLLEICNVGSNRLTFVDEPNITSPASTAANRFVTNGNVQLAAGACKPLLYDNTATRWRLWDGAVPDALRVRTCTLPFGSMNSSAPPLQDDDDQPAQCGNNTGRDWKITGIKVYANAGTPSWAPTLTGGAAMTTACTAAAGVWTACTLSGTPVVHSFSGAGSATCSTPSCTIDANVGSGSTAIYGLLEITGILQ